MGQRFILERSLQSLDLRHEEMSHCRSPGRGEADQGGGVKRDEVLKDYSLLLAYCCRLHVLDKWERRKKIWARCPGQGTDCTLLYLLAGCSSKGFNLPSVNALIAWLCSQGQHEPALPQKCLLQRCCCTLFPLCLLSDLFLLF